MVDMYECFRLHILHQSPLKCWHIFTKLRESYHSDETLQTLKNKWCTPNFLWSHLSFCVNYITLMAKLPYYGIYSPNTSKNVYSKVQELLKALYFFHSFLFYTDVIPYNTNSHLHLYYVHMILVQYRTTHSWIIKHFIIEQCFIQNKLNLHFHKMNFIHHVANMIPVN
jgi:hypothetical protein